MRNDSILQEDMEFIANSYLPFEQLQGKTVFITGGTGLIGSQLIRSLAWCNRKHGLDMKIIALIRNLDKAFSILGDLSTYGVTFFKGDVTDSDLNTVIDIAHIDYIIHAASVTASKIMVTNPVETIATALDGTRNLLELAKAQHSEAFVYISSMEVYGTFEEEKYVSESDMGYIDPLSVRSNYPLGKRMCENLCVAYSAEYGVPVKIARLSQTFGAGILPGENRVFAQFARSAMCGENIVLHTKGLSEGNYCYTRDTIIAILLIMLNGGDREASNRRRYSCKRISSAHRF